MEKIETVDEYIQTREFWSVEVVALRKILLTTDLVETVKWSSPAYTYQGKNVLGIFSFKSYFGVWFHQGALLEDSHGLLINASEGKTKALRQWRMKSKKEIKVRILKSYAKEAMALVGSGKEIKANRAKPLIVPNVLRSALAKNKAAHACFQAMTKGKRREYADYIADAKRDETKLKRLEKILPMILDGVGLNDKYRS